MSCSEHLQYQRKHERMYGKVSSANATVCCISVRICLQVQDRVCGASDALSRAAFLPLASSMESRVGSCSRMVLA